MKRAQFRVCGVDFVGPRDTDPPLARQVYQPKLWVRDNTPLAKDGYISLIRPTKLASHIVLRILKTLSPPHKFQYFETVQLSLHDVQACRGTGHERRFLVDSLVL